jgi:hypothetical protein
MMTCADHAQKMAYKREKAELRLELERLDR